MTDLLTRLTTALADRYRLERELGAGGMATVFLAHDLRHERDVAIKVLHPELGAALGADRFLSEIKTTARLQHPHILPLLDSGAADGLLFYVMPFISGETLRGRLERESQLPVSDALRIASEVADALATAHASNVVHRDIKPENILLQGGSGSTQHALVADFGIALAVQQAGGARMTQTGLSLGTPQYMSPEQAMGDKTVDHRADIYALGAVTYEMLTGEPPHMGTTAQAIVAKLLTEAVRPCAVLRPSVPAHVDAAVQQALSKLPADRFATVAEFRDALRDGTGLRTSLTSSATPAASRASRAVLAGAVLGAALLAAGGGWWAGRRTAPTANYGGDTPIVAPLALRAFASLFLTSIAVSDDGQQIAYSEADSLSSAVPRGMTILGLSNERLVRFGYGGLTSFSPDGSRLAVLGTGGEMQLVNADGTGTARTLGGGVSGVTWASDSVLVISSGGALARLSLTTGRRDSLPIPTEQGRLFSQLARWNERFVLAKSSPTIGEGDIGVIDLDANRFRALGVRGARPQYVEPGIVMYLRDGELWAVPVDPVKATPTGPERPVLNASTSKQLLAYGVSRTGVLVVRRGGLNTNESAELMIADRSGRATAATPERAPYRTVRFSPDGKRVVFTRTARVTLGSDVYVLQLGTQGLIRLTTDSINLAPEWAPDGRHVYFGRLGGAVRAGRGLPEVVRVNAEGGGIPEVVLRRTRQVYEFQLTPDERSMLWREDVALNSRDIFSGSLTASRSTAVTVADSGRSEQTSRFNERGIALSPDGQWYLYTSDETGTDQVYLARMGGSGARWPVSNGLGIEPRWARNGEAFFRRNDTLFVTRIGLGATPAVPPATALFAARFFSAEQEPFWDVSPDGQRFVFVKTAASNTAGEMLLITGWQARWRGEGKRP